MKILTYLNHIIRLNQISFVLTKYDALFLLERINLAPYIARIIRISRYFKQESNNRPGERLSKAFEELGPVFIKLGQALSVRSDLVGDEVADDLAKLRDNVPPFTSEEARKTIEYELDKSIHELFEIFIDEPVAAASIAQVHKAKTRDGRWVAVKVLRPGIEEIFKRDLELMMWLARIAKRRIKSLRRLKPVEVVKTFAKTVKLEMDLRLEAAAAAELRENFNDDKGFFVPQVDWLLTTQRVLTLEWIEGINIMDRAAIIAQGHNIDKILAISGESMFRQVFRDGFFHADMHPGNMFITKDGTIAVVDFGIMGRIDKKTRLYLAHMLHGFIKRDYIKVAKAHFDAGYVPKHQSLELFAQACRSIAEPIWGLPQNEISIARLLKQLFKITEDFEMETQPQLLLLQKTMMMAEGLGRILNPNVNIWKLTEPVMEEWAKNNLSWHSEVVGKLGDLKDIPTKIAQIFAYLEKTLDEISNDGIKLHPDTVEKLKVYRKD